MKITLDGCKTSPHQSPNLKVSIEALLSVLCTAHMVLAPHHYLRACPWTASGNEEGKWEAISKDRGGGEEPTIAGVWL